MSPQWTSCRPLDAPASSPHPKATLPLAGTPGLGPTVLLVASVLT